MVSQVNRILFASSHCLLDHSSGAAIATLDALRLLARAGFQCRVFCASKCDRTDGSEVVKHRKNVGRQTLTISGDQSIDLIHCTVDDVPIQIFETQSSSVDVWLPDEAAAMLAAFQRVADDFRPEVLLTYGGDPVTRSMMAAASQVLTGATRGRITPVLFWLHNFAYDRSSLFEEVDCVIVPSEFSRQWYQRKLNLDCHVLPYAIDWERVEVKDERGFDQNRLYVTFVNPQPAKGLFVFARIVEQLQRRRPDIPILVVESRGSADWLAQVPVDLSWCQNLHAMEMTPDPRDFYRVTRVLLVPSLWKESFGLVAAEAMINGIPVLASDRGALPEVLGAKNLGGENLTCPEPTPSGGFLFHIPERFQPETMTVPTAEEVSPWVETIIRLWDDGQLYRECSGKARVHAQQWKAE